MSQHQCDADEARPGPPVCWWSPCLLRVFVPPVVLCLAPVSRTPVLARITSPLISQRMRRESQSQHSINHQQSRVLITVIMIMHFDLSAGFFHVFNVILEVNKLTGGRVIYIYYHF